MLVLLLLLLVLDILNQLLIIRDTSNILDILNQILILDLWVSINIELSCCWYQLESRTGGEGVVGTCGSGHGQQVCPKVDLYQVVLLLVLLLLMDIP